jgi:hypothetical protein
MARPNRHSWPLLALIVALCLASGWVGAPSGVAAAEAKVPAWEGGINLYREGSFTTQKTWLWCTAADVQIIRNIVKRDSDHSTSGQRRYFDWMRDHNKYVLPESAGVDPQGWTAGLRHFVDDRYRLVASKSFDAALRSAVTNLRKTNLPVAVTVSRGNHGWVLTGFTATADPLTTDSFNVTSVRVVGPLFGLQSKNGYDMRPNTKLTTAQFRRFLTPWKYAPKKMVWDGLYVSIQPIPAKAAPVTTPKPAPPAPTATTTPAPSATPVPTTSPTPPTTPSPTVRPSPIAIAAAASSATRGSPAPSNSPTAAASAVPIILAIVLAALAVIGSLAGWRLGPLGRRPPGPRRR